MSLSNPNKPVTEARLSEFYDRIKGYMGGGGSGGTSDYTDLQNKPQIESVTLTGNKTAADLGLVKNTDVYAGDTAGLVPAAGSDNEGKYLGNDGNWTVVPMPMIGTINRSDIYDTTEKVIGKWTDGKPIYQKTIVDTLVNGSKDISLANINIDKIVDYNALMEAPNGVYQKLASNVFSDNDQYKAKCYIGISDNIFNKVIVVKNDNSNWGDRPITITLYYTKTTDAANSYNYADENDYSTTEKIVGTWIDGKPIYQKTISGTVTKSSDGNEVQTRINIGASVANVIKIDGFVKGGAATFALNFAKFKNANLTVLRTTANDNTAGTNPNVVTISENVFGTSDSQTYTAYVTLQYTKTTS